MFTGIVEALGTILEIHTPLPLPVTAIANKEDSVQSTLTQPLTSLPSLSSPTLTETHQLNQDEVTVLDIPLPSSSFSHHAHPSNAWTLVIGKCRQILDDCKLGDSIAVNGTCLTVTDMTPTQFTVNVCEETLKRTNLMDLQVSDVVNLERAMLMTDRFHGHCVQGHVDTTVSIVACENCMDGSLVVSFSLPKEKEYMSTVIGKGYVCLDGTSLTVCDVDLSNHTFTVSLVLFTQPRTVLSFKALRYAIDTKKKYLASVNFEADILVKSFQHLLRLDGWESPSSYHNEKDKLQQHQQEQHLHPYLKQVWIKSETKNLQ